MTRTNDDLPDKFTQAQAREANRKYWEQAGGQTFANGEPPMPATPAPISGTTHEELSSRPAVAVPAPAGGTGQAQISREHNQTLGKEGPLATGPESAVERGVPRQTESGLRPASPVDALPKALSPSQLAAYSSDAPRNQSARTSVPVGPTKAGG